MTDLRGWEAVLEDLPTAPEQLCEVVRGVVISAGMLRRMHELPTPADKTDHVQIRPAAGIVAAIQRARPGPITRPLPPEQRFVGNCRHFAVLAAALVRHIGRPARARCGFHGGFPGETVSVHIDHWVTEYWDGQAWRRIDPQVDRAYATAVGVDLADGEPAPPRQFLSGGEAWQLCRAGQARFIDFGITTDAHDRGPAEIRGNAIRDLAALNKVEVLPWDSWGRMDASYEGATDAAYDEFIDAVAEACAGPPREARRLYRSQPELCVPPALIAPTTSGENG